MNPAATQLAAAQRLVGHAFGGHETPYDWLARAVSRTSRTVLDVGCGAGTLMSRLSANTVIGVDPTLPLLEIARAETGRVCVQAALDHLPFEDDSFDAVVSCLAFSDAGSRQRLLAEAARVLRPGGALAVLLPSVRPLNASEMALVSRLAGFLRTPPWLPGDAELTPKKSLESVGLTPAEDTRARFVVRVRDRADAETLVAGLRPAPDRVFTKSAVDFLVERAGEQGVDFPLPMRRLVALK